MPKTKKRSRVVSYILNATGTILQILLAAIFYIIIVIAMTKAVKYAYDFSYQIFGDVSVEAVPGNDVQVQILKGESTLNIASKLELSKVIVNKYSFFIKVKLEKRDIMPGTFIVNTSMSYDELLDVITDYSKSLDKDETTLEEIEGKGK